MRTEVIITGIATTVAKESSYRIIAAT